MKILMFICALLIGNFVNAQEQVIHETVYEYAVCVDNEWSEWNDCDIQIEINLPEDRVVIYSKKLQIYRIIEVAPTPPDKTGTQIGFTMIDQDDDVGRIRFRVQNNGGRQIYIDFQDVSWCYQLK